MLTEHGRERGRSSAATRPSRHGRRIDWERREPVSLAVQRAVGDVEDRDPTDLPPLADAVDPDALEGFFAGDPEEMDDRTLSFSYAGHAVRVEGAGRVLVD